MSAHLTDQRVADAVFFSLYVWLKVNCLFTAIQWGHAIGREKKIPFILKIKEKKKVSIDTKE